MAHAHGTQTSAATPVRASTLLLVRDGAAGLEIFMVRRHQRIGFTPGAMVFPGGKVDPLDADPALHARCRGAVGLTTDELALRVAAIREAFEECGVLLARPRGEASLVSAERLREISEHHRADLHSGCTTLPALVEAEDLELACDLPIPFAHWITPAGSPRRYDTLFFLVAAPPDHVAAHDGLESVDSVWISPARALAEEEAGRLTIIFPTLMNLRKLGRSKTVAQAVAAARNDTIVTVLPAIEQAENGAVIRIPAAAGYDLVEAPIDPRVGSIRRGSS